jgi:hypothetical protein
LRVGPAATLPENGAAIPDFLCAAFVILPLPCVRCEGGSPSRTAAASSPARASTSQLSWAGATASPRTAVDRAANVHVVLADREVAKSLRARQQAETLTRVLIEVSAGH